MKPRLAVFCLFMSLSMNILLLTTVLAALANGGSILVVVDRYNEGWLEVALLSIVLILTLYSLLAKDPARES